MILGRNTSAQTQSDKEPAQPSHVHSPPDEEAPHEIISELAHNLNNLLTPIVALSACLEHQLQQHDSAYEQARDIRITAERAAEFVQRTLESVRHSTASAKHVCLALVVTEMQALLRNIAGAGVAVETLVAPDSGLALVDRSRFEAALIDLVANARDAIQGKGSVSVESSSVTLNVEQAHRLGALPAGEYVLVAVRDTGQGIPQVLRQRIFERFFTTKPAGTGLGLHHVQRFVADSQGLITMHSEEGRGTTFSLYFPRVAAHELDPAETSWRARR